MRKPFAALAVTGTPWTAQTTPRTGMPAIAAPVTGPARLPLLATHADVAPEHQHFLDRIVLTRGWISGAFQVLLHSPDAASRIAHIGAFFNYETMLEPQSRMLVWLVTAREFDCNYIWQTSVNAARRAGLDDELIATIESDRGFARVPPANRLLCEFCCQLLRGNHHVDDGTHRSMIAAFGTAATVQIAATVGYIVMMSVIVNALNVAPAPDDGRPAL